jgi:hypothetical protein
LLDAAQWPVRPDPAASCGIENVQSPLNYRSSEKSEMVRKNEMSGDCERTARAGNLTLAQLVQDPLIGLLMKSDGVDRNSIEALFARIAQQRANGSRAHIRRFG